MEERNLKQDISFPLMEALFGETDPDWSQRFDYFAQEEATVHGELDQKTRLMVTLAASIALPAPKIFQMLLKMAMDNEITPAEIKEIVYQTIPYVGIGRAVSFLQRTNQFLKEEGIPLPMEDRSVTTLENRKKEGMRIQMDIFGDRIAALYQTAPKEQLHIQEFLSANCFGDYYTRKGLTIEQRELLTFAVLLSLGGCEAQLKAHILGNLQVGNTRQLLLDTVTQLLPLVGYPRTLNAILCLDAALAERESAGEQVLEMDDAGTE